MRNHVGFHIIHKDVVDDSHRFGYCDNVGCAIELVTTSGFGRSAAQGPKSDCPYVTSISKWTDNKLVRSYPCSNRPGTCEQCSAVYWSYNLNAHYNLCQLGLNCPEQVSTEEYDFI